MTYELTETGDRISNVKTNDPLGLGAATYAQQIGLEGIPAYVSLPLYHLHFGDTQRFTYKNAGLSNGAEVNFYFKSNSSKEIHFKAITVYSKGNIEYFEYVKPYSTITVDTLGTDYKPKTKNAHGNYISTKQTTIEEIRLDTTFTALTNELWTLIFPGTGTGVTAFPLMAEPKETILETNSERVFKFKNVSGLATIFSVDFYFNEEKPGGLGG